MPHRRGHIRRLYHVWTNELLPKPSHDLCYHHDERCYMRVTRTLWTWYKFPLLCWCRPGRYGHFHRVANVPCNWRPLDHAIGHTSEYRNLYERYLTC
ncbi:hypothetical protein OESDEN_16533 [Oesophagostomum dentatum]|uniref:Uncharacterized protein n=1 Tax=Oesophagostomum dentatum TaxID=61180 RepID=A0A0B1SEM7_OESDE|nr:hypothetical protein OESDEN_16533 [Oesophagostomum dentatum]